MERCAFMPAKRRLRQHRSKSGDGSGALNAANELATKQPVAMIAVDEIKTGNRHAGLSSIILSTTPSRAPVIQTGA